MADSDTLVIRAEMLSDIPEKAANAVPKAINAQVTALQQRAARRGGGS